MTSESTEKQLESIEYGLKEAKKYHLESEVMLWAMFALKKNPKMTITEAINHGVNEWLK